MSKKKVLVISTSLRAKSNSNELARAFARGAESAGHEVEFVSLRGKKIAFCVGCLSCGETGKCAIRDDMAEIEGLSPLFDVAPGQTAVYTEMLELCRKDGKRSKA